jgi:Flp pilus assembly protein TadD
MHAAAAALGHRDIESHRTCVGDVPMTLELLMREAGAAVDAGQLHRAHPLLLQIVGLNPRDAEAWHMLAIIALRTGQPAEAIDSAMRALHLDRRNHLYLNTLGVAHGEQQQLGEAVRWFTRALKERPNHAESHYNLGKAQEKLGQIVDAERSYMRARRLEPARADVMNNLALLYARQGRYDEALPLLAEAFARTPHDERVAINSAYALLATSGPQACLRELRAFLEHHPGAAAVHAEFGRRLLAEGRFAEGWSEYGWRHGVPPPPLPDPAGKRVLVLPDQGLGDQLFFLRFAAKLGERAAEVSFDCPEKLASILDMGPRKRDYDLALPGGDLPRLLKETGTPAPLAIRADEARVAAWRERLAMLGRGPYVAATWRGGTKRAEPEFARQGEDALHKEIDAAVLGAALGNWPGTVLIVQRLPLAKEVPIFSSALGRHAHDLSSANDDLADIAALLSLTDEYVGVSNTNMHLYAGLGKKARVLVPFPPEFRWMHASSTSPWFPGFSVYRQAPSRDWADALSRLTMDLTH